MKPKIYNFDLLSYPHMSLDAPGTPVPSTYFDPLLGARNYEEHLREMEYCEELGFDGVVFNEHHYSAYGTMPSPNLIAAALSRTTRRIKIGVLGNILPLRGHPVRVAEEYAMIDCLSGGRLIAGFVRGIPAEYLWYNVNPEESRGRFEEAYELIVKAWTEPVCSYHGKFFQLENCALWPRPVQQPHPTVWVAARSAESVEWCARNKLPIAQVYQTTGQIEDTFNYYRQTASELGWNADPAHFILCRHIYIDDSDTKMQRRLEPALRYFFKLHDRGFNQGKAAASAPLRQVKEALYTERSFNYFRPGNRERLDFSALAWDELEQTGYLVAGNPDTVARKLNQQMRQVGAGHFMGIFHIGNLTHDKVMASLGLFRDEVMPRLQEL
jgi:alkanesulfonate monooxygenase SsuD/methylene tetrahydromethanopterin reductase-like flavin-dependent oxidoreductase (luciferase family)